jgi:PAS domain S-box-containing protein
LSDRSEGDVPRGESLETLRRRAEAKLAEVVRSHGTDLRKVDVKRLVHDLSVHQAELELQNEELNRTQIALEASRARYFDLYDHAPVGYMTFGLDGLVLEANRLAASMLGVPKTRLVGRRLSDYLSPECRPLFSERYTKLLAQQPAGVCELLFVRADHTHFWAQLEMTLLLDETPGVAQCRAAVIDIAERKDIQQRLASLAQIVASSDDLIIGQDLNGRVTSWNLSAERLLGYTAREMIGKTLHALLPPEKADELEAFRNPGRGDAVTAFDSELTSRNGRAVPLSLSLSPVRDEANRLIGKSIVGRDISDRVAVHRALERRLRQLDLLAHTGQTLIMTDDASPAVLIEVFGEVSQVIGADIHVYYQLGATASELELVASSGVPQDGLERTDTLQACEALSTRVAQKRTIVVEEALRHTGRSRTPGLPAQGISCYAGFPLIVRGALIGVVGFAARANDRFQEGDLQVVQTIRDQISTTLERLVLLDELRIDDQVLKDADRRKDDFIATLAHELRNPLAPISNAVNILRRLDNSNPVQENLVEMMARQVTHMARLVDDLLDVSRVSRGKLVLGKARVELASVLNNAIDTSRPLIEAAAHRFKVDLPGEPLVVEADAGRLSQAFANLLNNAAKYTESGGQITLSARREDDQVEVCVEDTGYGISTELLPHVFDMFVQGTQRSPGHTGVGIGLTLVRALVDMHGGSVQALSAGLNQGSRFVVRLPLAAGLPAATQWQLAALTLSSRCRALLVDDNRDVVDSLGSLLRLMGAQVDVVYDGPSALDTIDRFHPTAMIIDIGMPGMDGYEVARRVRARPHGGEILLIALTGWGQHEDRIRTRRAGFDHHLVKPADLNHLQRLLHTEDA